MSEERDANNNWKRPLAVGIAIAIVLLAIGANGALHELAKGAGQ